MNQEFDPAVELVLETFGRLFGRSADASDADAVAGVLEEAADPLGAELARTVIARAPSASAAGGRLA